MYTLKTQPIPAETINFIRTIVDKGGPEPHEYQMFTEVVDSLREDELDQFRDLIIDTLNEQTLMGYCYVKPFGYPGDFAIISNIYSRYVNPDPKYGNWDTYFQYQPGANAVRNRKDYFLRTCATLEEKNNEPKKVLILGSGPATDVNEYLTGTPDSKIEFTLIDFDQNAIDFAKKQNEKFNGSIEYFKINVLRYKPYNMYDLIWSAGLFDYFKDKHFIYVIQKYYKFIKSDGAFIVGNFSNKNPTRRLMEVISQWYLNHRSKFDLMKLAIEAGVKEEKINVDSEELGVNLFLRMKAESSNNNGREQKTK